MAQSSSSATNTPTDGELDTLLQDIKPWYLTLKDKNAKRRAHLWIKKLGEYEALNKLDKERRNNYLNALLAMLRSERFLPPFHQDPNDDRLDPLPPNLVIGQKPKAHSLLPDWLTDDESKIIAGSMPLASSSCIPWANTSGISSVSSLTEPGSFRRELDFDLDDIESMSTISEERTSQLLSGRNFKGMQDSSSKANNNHSSAAPPLSQHHHHPHQNQAVQSSGDYMFPSAGALSTFMLPNSSTVGFTSLMDWPSQDYVAQCSTAAVSKTILPDLAKESNFLTDLSPKKPMNNTNNKADGDMSNIYSKLQHAEPEERERVQVKVDVFYNLTGTLAQVLLTYEDISTPPSWMDCSKQLHDLGLVVLLKVILKAIEEGGEKAWERRTVELQGKFHEEMLHQQQQHDAEIKQLLNRKNAELEEQKLDYSQKMDEQIAVIAQLEKKIRIATQEMNAMRELRERELSEIKRSLTNARELKDVEWEQKLTALSEDFVSERNRLVKTHEDTQRQFMTETQATVHKLETDFELKRSELEREMHRLQDSFDSVKSQKMHMEEKMDALEDENKELAKKLHQANRSLKELQSKFTSLEEQYQLNITEHEAEVQALEDKYTTTIHHLKEEKTIQADRHKEMLDDLNEQMEDLRRVIRTTDEAKSREFTSKEAEWAESKALQQRDLMKRLHDLEESKDTQLAEVKKQWRCCQQSLVEKQEELEHCKLDLERIKSQNSESMQELRHSLECASQRKLAELHHQLQQAVQQRAQDQQLLDNLRQAQQMALQKRDDQWEEEKQRLIAQQEWMLKDAEQRKEKIIKQLKEEYDDSFRALKRQSEKQMDAMEQRIQDLEKQLTAAQEAQFEEAQLRQNQLAELGSARELERSTLLRQHREEMDRVRSECEHSKQDLKCRHAQEIEQFLKKMNMELEQVRLEAQEEKNQTKQRVQSITQQLKKSRESHQMKKKLWEEQMQRLAQTSSDVKKQLEDTTRQLAEEFELAKQSKDNLIEELQSQLEQCRQEHEAHLYRHQAEYEMKLHRLLPREIQTDYEETIQSLKAQISVLHQRMAILERNLPPPPPPLAPKEYEPSRIAQRISLDRFPH